MKFRWLKVHQNKDFAVRLLTVAAHLLAWAPAALLLTAALAGQLGVNPIQTAVQRMGRAAAWLLTAALAVTPVQTLSGWRALQRLARPLGLYAAAYAGLHLLLNVGLDYGFNFSLWIPDMLGKQYIFFGLAALLILLALAGTSFRWWMRRLGRRWKQLHRLVYLAGVLAVVHYGLAAKGNLLTLRGNVAQPALMAGLLALLLALRLPFVRRWAAGLRARLSAGFGSHSRPV